MTMPPRAQEDEAPHWVLDKKVPIALIVAIAMQSAGAFWWAAGITQRVEYLERQQTVAQSTSGPLTERVIRVEAKLEAVRETLAEIKALLRARRAEGQQ